MAHEGELDEMAVVQAGGGGVEPAVIRDGPLGQRGCQGVAVRGVGNEASPLEFFEDVTHVGTFRRLVRVVVGWHGSALRLPLAAAGARRAIGRNRGVIWQPESPREHLAVSAATRDAGAGPGGIVTRRRGWRLDVYPSARGDVETGVLPGESQRLGQSGRAAGEVAVGARRRSPSPCKFVPRDDLPGPQQYRAGAPERTAHEVGAPVHAV